MSVPESLAIRHVCIAGLSRGVIADLIAAVPSRVYSPYSAAGRRRHISGVRSGFDRWPSERELMQIAATQRRGDDASTAARIYCGPAASLSKHEPLFHHSARPAPPTVWPLRRALFVKLRALPPDVDVGRRVVVGRHRRSSSVAVVSHRTSSSSISSSSSYVVLVAVGRRGLVVKLCVGFAQFYRRDSIDTRPAGRRMEGH